MAEEGESGAAVHLPLDHFCLGVHALGPSIVERQGDGGGGGVDVQVQAAGEGVDVRQAVGVDAAEVTGVQPAFRHDALPAHPGTGEVWVTGRAKDLIIRGGHNIDPRVIEEALLRHPAVAAAAAVGRPDRHSGEVPAVYVIDPDQFDEAELMAWARTAIGEPAARPKRMYPVTAIPVTEVGKHFKPALAADAAVRVVTEALADAGLPDARAAAAHEDGRLVITVTGADPGRVQEAAAGFPLSIRCLP